jgi:hypothetical protein
LVLRTARFRFLPLYFSGRIFTARRLIVAARESKADDRFSRLFFLGRTAESISRSYHCLVSHFLRICCRLFSFLALIPAGLLCLAWSRLGCRQGLAFLFLSSAPV